MPQFFKTFNVQRVNTKVLSKKLARLFSALIFVVALLPMQQAAAQVGSPFGGSATSGNTNPCAVNPCLNGGTCIQEPDTYSCACTQGNFGVNCQFYDTAFLPPPPIDVGVNNPGQGPVHVTTPSTLVLFLLGLVGFIGLKLSRRKKHS